MSDVVLTAGVRQICCRCEDRRPDERDAEPAGHGQEGQFGLDNPTNFFTSQSLNTRASDLNALLNSIGQAQKTSMPPVPASPR